MAKKFDKQAWQEEQAQKLEAAQEALTTGLRSLVTSGDWEEMLRAMAVAGRFGVHRFSFANFLLLCSQRPGVRNVATFKAWQSVGRRVKKGEKALMILAPRHIKPRSKIDATKREDGPGEKREDLAAVPRRRRLVGFRAMAVFAEDQTEGEPLPAIRLPKVTEEEAFAESVETLRRVALALEGSPVSLIEIRPRRVGDLEGAAGWYAPMTREIVVLTTEGSRAQQFKTLVHEVAHAILHGVGDHHSAPEREVEAESTAFVVCHALGLDTAARSFPYVAVWARGERALEMIAASGERIARASRIILEALAPEIPEETGAEARAA